MDVEDGETGDGMKSSCEWRPHGAEFVADKNHR